MKTKSSRVFIIIGLAVIALGACAWYFLATEESIEVKQARNRYSSELEEARFNFQRSMDQADGNASELTLNEIRKEYILAREKAWNEYSQAINDTRKELQKGLELRR